MKKSIFTLLLSGLAMAGFVHAASPLGGEAMSPKAEEEPAYDWYVVDSNRMSGVTADDVDDEGVLGYASVAVGAAQPDEAGAIFEGEPYSMVMSNVWNGDYVEYSTYIDEPGRYKFSYRVRGYMWGTPYGTQPLLLHHRGRGQHGVG